MASVLSTIVSRPFSTAFRSLTPTCRLPKMCGESRTINPLSVSRVSSRSHGHAKPSSSSLSRLNGHRLSSTCYSLGHGGFRTVVPLLPRFSVGSGELGTRNTGHRIFKWVDSTTSVRLEMRRPISCSVQQLAEKKELVTIHFINRDGEKMTVKAWTGQNLLDIVVDNDLDIDGYGACEGTLSCSTCHLIFAEDLFKVLPKPSDEELDMLDLAYGQTDMSRLGCQVILTKEMDGMTVVVPDGVADARDA